MTTTTMAPDTPRFQRLVSIDVLRGLTIAFMILVNNNGNNDLAYRALNHSPWNGCTPTDLVFPTFLFIMGISLVLSYMARIGRGEKRTTLLGHIFRRFVLLFFLGLVVNGFPYFHLATLRIYGVLQRIAVCYLLASLLLLVTRRVWVMIGLTVALLAGYWVLLRWVPVPGHGMPVRNFPFMDHDINLVAWLDRHIFPHRLYERTRDPEGLLSDLPAFASTLLGMLTAFWMRTARSQQAKAIGMAVAALLLLIAGYVWGFDFPINKKLWTSSYVLFAAGWSMLLLAISYSIIEIRNWRGSWTRPFLVFGMNAITAYVLSELLSSVVSVFHVNGHQSFQEWSYSVIFKPIINPAFGSLLYSLAFVLVCFIPVWVLYRRKIFLKL
jgi:predicted acyltransferase